MGHDSEDTNHSAPLRLIYDERRRVQEARNQYWHEAVRNDVSNETHQLLAAVAVEYFDVLYEFRAEAVLDEDDWPNIDQIRSRIGKTTTVKSQAPGRSAAMTHKEVPAVTEVPPEEIIRITKELDDLAKTLGFAAEATAVVPEDEADVDDLNELLKNRGHNDVAERLPGDD